MNCNIGLLSEFEEKHPDAVLRYNEMPIRLEERIMGISCLDLDEMWILVDRIAFLERRPGHLIDTLTNATIHEMIHLCGVSDERTAKFGEKMVRIK